nr:transposase [Acetivibrio ethanolgignens]
MVLHTFGRDLKWNPHIHCLISEGGYSDDGFWRHVNHFNYTFLRNAFRTALLNEMESKIGPSFKKVKAKCCRDHPQGFYVYAKPNVCDPKNVVKYIGRYLGRPVTATSRIDKYDGEMVTFHYNRHEDEQYVEETIPAMEFIQRLIRHIPEKNYKMIRYGGLYARHRDIDSKLHHAISKSKHSFYRSFNHQRVSLEEMYENQSNLIHNIFWNIKYFLVRLFITSASFQLYLIHVHIFKIIHIQVCIFYELYNLSLQLILIFHKFNRMLHRHAIHVDNINFLRKSKDLTIFYTAKRAASRLLPITHTPPPQK